MNKKIFGGIAIVAIAVAVAFNVTISNQKQDKTSMLALANVEALASETLNVGDVPWYDFINNYKGDPQQIPVTTSERTAGSVTFRGVEVEVSSTKTYSYAIYTPCYDGGSKNECTSDIITYI